MQSDWLGVVEAAYRTDIDEQAWLNGVLEAARPMLDHQVGVAALLYDASSTATLVPLRFITTGAPHGLSPGHCLQLIQQGNPDADFLARTFGALSCGLLSKTFGAQFPHILDHLKDYGVVDMLAVNGVDPSLHGCFLTGNLPSDVRSPLASRTRAMWARVSVHLAAGYRVRRRLAAQPEDCCTEAVLTPSGQLEHAEGEAREREAREALRDAVQLLQQAKSRLRHAAPDTAIDLWKGLVNARWSLLDQFENDGKHYVVARRNEGTTLSAGPLSPRERQVVAYVALGHANKVIAYELGLSTSTIGVLVTRAARKLGVKSRAELARAYQSMVQGTSTPAA